MFTEDPKFIKNEEVISLRDKFAIAALQSIDAWKYLRNDINYYDDSSRALEIAHVSYILADAMLRIKKKEEVENMLSGMSSEILSSFIEHIDKSKTILPFDIDEATPEMQDKAINIHDFFTESENIDLKLKLRRMGKNLAIKFNSLEFNNVFLLKSQETLLCKILININNIRLRLTAYYSCSDNDTTISADMICYDADLINSKEIL